jgi:hypothetical protein
MISSVVIFPLPLPRMCSTSFSPRDLYTGLAAFSGLGARRLIGLVFFGIPSS